MISNADFLKVAILITITFIEYFIVKYILIKLKNIDITDVVTSETIYRKNFNNNNKKSSTNIGHVEMDMKSNFYIEDVDSSNLKSSSKKGEVKTKAEKLKELRKKGKI